MAEQIISASGVQHGLIITPEGAIPISGTFAVDLESVFVQSGNAAFGYTTNQVIRKASGSPSIDYIFSSAAEAFMIDNLGSSPIFFSLDATLDDTNSGTGFISEFTFRSFDGRVTTISIQGSGLTSPIVQTVRLT